MKLPFASVIGPPLKKYHKLHRAVCSPMFMGLKSFTVCFGILGLVLTIMDIVRIVQGGSTLSKELWYTRRVHKREQTVKPEVERDLKLMASALAIEHYALLVAGAHANNPALLLPWLFTEALVIFLEVVLFFSRIFVEGLHLDRVEILITAVMIHNWLQVFCLLRRMITTCDL